MRVSEIDELGLAEKLRFVKERTLKSWEIEGSSHFLAFEKEERKKANSKVKSEMTSMDASHKF